MLGAGCRVLGVGSGRAPGMATAIASGKSQLSTLALNRRVLVLNCQRLALERVGCRVLGAGCRVYGVGCRVLGVGCRV